MNMSALYFVLGIPLLGSVVLAWCGHRGFARDVNVGFSLATFSAAGVLTAQVISAGPLFAWRHEFFIDPLNVFLVSLTAFVVLTTAFFRSDEHTSELLSLIRFSFAVFCFFLYI